MIKQTTPYGCGMYAVANSCNLPNFATPERLAKSEKYGNLTGRLDQWMQEDGFNFYMQPLFYDPKANKITPEQCDYSLSGNATSWPLVACVTLSEGGKSHMVAVNLFKGGVCLLMDSLRTEPITCSLIELNDLYHDVFGLFAFCCLDTGDYAFIS